MEKQIKIGGRLADRDPEVEIRELTWTSYLELEVIKGGNLLKLAKVRFLRNYLKKIFLEVKRLALRKLCC